MVFPARLSFVPAAAGANTPVLMQFPAGAPPNSVIAQKDGLRLQLTRSDSSGKKKAKQQLQAESAMMRYAGVDHGREAKAAKAAGSLMIGIHNPETGAVRLLPPSALFVMEPSVRDPRMSLEAPATAASAAAGSIEALREGAARKRELVATLGSAKALKKQKATAATAVSAESVFNTTSLGADIAGAADAADAAPHVGLTTADRHSLHPLFNLDATSVADAYPRAGLIPDVVWAEVTDSPYTARKRWYSN